MDKITEDKWWQDINGVPPDTEQIYRQQQVKMQQGVIDGHHLTVQSQSNRIDWVLTTGKQIPNESQQNTIESLPTLLEFFLKIVKCWLKACPPSSRLAFGASLVKQVSDMRSGHEYLLQLLPNLNLNPDDVSDLIYQVNRRKKSMSAPGIMINRLCRWSVVQIHNIGVTMDAVGTPISSSSQEHYACKLDLDINTVPSDDNIPTNNAYPIFEELTKYGCTIAAKGDVK